jgi:hypothetical protein
MAADKVKSESKEGTCKIRFWIDNRSVHVKIVTIYFNAKIDWLMRQGPKGEWLNYWLILDEKKCATVQILKQFQPMGEFHSVA